MAPDFFIVGLQKSGTYWVTALLDAHPEIRCLPSMYGGQTGVREGRVFDMLASIDEDGGEAFRNSFSKYHDGFYADLVPLLGKISREELYAKFRDRYAEWIEKHRDGKRLAGDKTTEYIFHLDMIDDFYPHTRFSVAPQAQFSQSENNRKTGVGVYLGVKKICILRDVRDRIVSWHFDMMRKHGKTDPTITDNFVRDYLSRVKKEYEAMLAYDGHIHCFTYEALQKNTEEIVRGMLEYLGAKSPDEIIEKMIEEASLERLRKKDKLAKEGAGKKRGEEVPQSHYRKGVVGDWKNRLSAAQAKMIADEIGELERRVFEKYHIGN